MRSRLSSKVRNLFLQHLVQIKTRQKEGWLKKIEIGIHANGSMHSRICGWKERDLEGGMECQLNVGTRIFTFIDWGVSLLGNIFFFRPGTYSYDMEDASCSADDG